MNTVNDKLELQLNSMMELVHNEGATKKSLLLHAENFIDSLVDSGYLNSIDALGKLTKMKDYLSVVDKKLREDVMDDLNETKEAYVSSGVSFQHRSGSRILNVKDDLVMQQLTDKMKDRKLLLKTSQEVKNKFYDGEGVEVPKVGYSHQADSVVIKY